MLSKTLQTRTGDAQKCTNTHSRALIQICPVLWREWTNESVYRAGQANVDERSKHATTKCCPKHCKRELGMLKSVQTRTVVLSSKSVQFCGVSGQMKVFIGQARPTSMRGPNMRQQNVVQIIANENWGYSEVYKHAQYCFCQNQSCFAA